MAHRPGHSRSSDQEPKSWLDSLTSNVSRLTALIVTIAAAIAGVTLVLTNLSGAGQVIHAIASGPGVTVSPTPTLLPPILPPASASAVPRISNSPILTVWVNTLDEYLVQPQTIVGFHQFTGFETDVQPDLAKQMLVRDWVEEQIVTQPGFHPGAQPIHVHLVVPANLSQDKITAESSPAVTTTLQLYFIPTGPEYPTKPDRKALETASQLQLTNQHSDFPLDITAEGYSTTVVTVRPGQAIDTSFDLSPVKLRVAIQTPDGKGNLSTRWLTTQLSTVGGIDIAAPDRLPVFQTAVAVYRAGPSNPVGQFSTQAVKASMGIDLVVTVLLE